MGFLSWCVQWAAPALAFSWTVASAAWASLSCELQGCLMCFLCCEITLPLFAAGSSPTCEPPLRRTWLGATRPCWRVTGPCRTPSAGSSGTPASQGARACDQGTPGRATSDPGHQRWGSTAAVCVSLAALAAPCSPLLQNQLPLSVKGKKQTPSAPELCERVDTFLWRGKLVSHVALCWGRLKQ